MNISTFFTTAIATIGIFVSGAMAQKQGWLNTPGTDFIRAAEPLLLSAGGETKPLYLLPAGTALYEDASFPEGHTRYVAYISIKGDFAHEKVHSDKVKYVSPVWAYTVKPDEVKKLMDETPISRADLVSILKARNITREELVQVLREWEEPK